MIAILPLNENKSRD